MSAGHTPGPWRAAGEHVFSVNGRLTVTYANYGTKNERIANARLIAAAPALLLELEMTVDLLERASRTLTEECKSALDGRQWGGVRIASARAALSLAKGESA